MEELEPGKPVYVMCQNGLHSYAACRLLTQAGYDCAYFSGGYHFYENILIDSIATQHVSCG